MEDVNNWQVKFESCQYSDRLINKLLLLNKTTKNPVDIQEVKKAIYYAKKYHGNQMRESGQPYYSHPIEVAYMVADYLFKTDSMVVSILHDTIEDTTMTAGMIIDIFGRVVAGQVDDLTRIKFNKKITAGESVNLLFTQYKKDVLHVKLFDRLHNVQTIKYMPSEKIKRIIDETIIYFIPLATYLSLTDVQEELVKLCIQTELAPQEIGCSNIGKKSSFKASFLVDSVSQSVLERIYKL